MNETRKAAFNLIQLISLRFQLHSINLIKFHLLNYLVFQSAAVCAHFLLFRRGELVWYRKPILFKQQLHSIILAQLLKKKRNPNSPADWEKRACFAFETRYRFKLLRSGKRDWMRAKTKTNNKFNKEIELIQSMPPSKFISAQ